MVWISRIFFIFDQKRPKEPNKGRIKNMALRLILICWEASTYKISSNGLDSDHFLPFFYQKRPKGPKKAKKSWKRPKSKIWLWGEFSFAELATGDQNWISIKKCCCNWILNPFSLGANWFTMFNPYYVAIKKGMITSTTWKYDL